MAAFNPEVPDQGTPDFTGASRGPGVNRSFEALFSGVGDVVTQATQTADTYVQNRIEDDARFGFDEQNKELGVGGDSVPPELTRSQEGLSTLALAMEQGKVTPEYYYQRLAATTKGLRAKYPGYEKKVDEIIQKVTGTRPANAYRDQLFQNLASAQEQARSQASKDDTFIRSNLDLLWGNEQSLPKDQQIALISQRKGLAGKWDYDAQMAKNQDTLAGRNADEIANTITAQSIASVGDSVGIGSNDFLQVLQNASKKPLDPDQLAQVNSSLTTAKAAVGNRIRTEILKRYPSISGTDLEAKIKAATSQFDDIQTELNSGRYDMAARIATSNKIAIDQRTSDLMTQFPELKTIMSINNTAGSGASQDLFQRYIQQGFGGNSGFSEKLLSFGMAKATAQGTYSVHDLSKAIAGNGQMKGSEKSSLLKNFLDGYSQTAEDIDNQSVGNFVKKNYTESSGESVLWSENGIVPNDQKLLVFNKLFDPKISKKIQNSGDQEAASQYLATAVDRFQNIPDYKKAASGLNEYLPELKKYFDIGYDSSKNQIFMTKKEGATFGVGTAYGVLGESSPAYRRDVAAMNKMIGKINQGMGLMGPVFDAGGVDRTEGMKQIFNDMHLDLDQSQAGQGFWEWLGQGLSKPASAEGVDVSMSRENMGLDDEAQTIPALPELTFQNLESVRTGASGNMSRVLDLIGHTEGTDKGASYNETLGYGAYTGGPVNLTGMSLNEIDNLQSQMLKHPDNSWNSSAVGRYQIVRTTLRNLKKQLGLSGDEKFTPALQDRLAEQLLKNRGYDDWKSGKISDKRFINNLAQEWASLPNSRGVGAYSGQGVRATPNQVLSALSE